MYKTKALEGFPEIEWETDGEIVDNDPEERMVVRAAEGFDANGKHYMGIAYFYCDECESIKDIEALD